MATTFTNLNAKPALTLDAFRMLKASIFAGKDVAAPVKFVGFGSGGHTAENTAKNFDSTRVALFKEDVVVEVGNVFQPDGFQLSVSAVVFGSQISVISEVILYDEKKRPMCMATFNPKYTEIGESYGVTLVMHF